MRHATKNLLRVAVLTVLCLLRHINVSGCDICGCFIGVLPYDNQSSIGIMHRYRIFSGYPSISRGTLFPQGAYRLSNPPSVLHTGHTTTLAPDDFESYKVIELRGKLFIHERVELNFILPFSENRSKINGEIEKINGLGDATILAGFHLVKTGSDKNFRHRLVLGLGIKLPTGNCSSTSADGDRNFILIQNGTGSTDGIIYSAYTGGGNNFRWGATVSGKINGTNKYNEHLSPSSASTVFFGYLLSSGDWHFLPQISGYHEFTRGLWENNQLVAETKMNAALAGPGLDVYYKNLRFSCGLQLPVYEIESPANLLNRGKLMISFNWSFNQLHFLFHKKNV
ncbi:hypothetical protein BH11BAC7_BH11BAC7_05760 [soil metagenome]